MFTSFVFLPIDELPVLPCERPGPMPLICTICGAGPTDERLISDPLPGFLGHGTTPGEPDSSQLRLDGAAEWARLDQATRDAIGAAALELVTASMGVDRYIDRRAACRPFEAAHSLLGERLEMQILEAVPALRGSELPVPACVGRLCRVCGCTDEDGCYVGGPGLMCGWLEDDLCSACSSAAQPAGDGLNLAPVLTPYQRTWRRVAAAYRRLRHGHEAGQRPAASNP